MLQSARPNFLHSLISVVDVPATVCTTTCKSVQVREKVLRLRKVLRIIFLILQYHFDVDLLVVRPRDLKCDELCILLDFINKLV